MTTGSQAAVRCRQVRHVARVVVRYIARPVVRPVARHVARHVATCQSRGLVIAVVTGCFGARALLTSTPETGS